MTTVRRLRRSASLFPDQAQVESRFPQDRSLHLLRRPAVAIDVDRVAARPSGDFRGATIGAVVGFAVVSSAIIAAGLIGGIGLGPALGVGVWVGFWGGCGFGFMLGGTAPPRARRE
jgi:hypothetical protein